MGPTDANTVEEMALSVEIGVRLALLAHGLRGRGPHGGASKGVLSQIGRAGPAGSGARMHRGRRGRGALPRLRRRPRIPRLLRMETL
jgi:hypothetical protein